MALRLAIVADIHHGRTFTTKRGDRALSLLGEFAHFVRDQRVSHVLELGDRISDESRDRDLALQAEVADALRSLPVPIWHLNGNHDLEHLEVADTERLLGQSLRHETHDLEGWRLVLWRADTRIRRNGSSPGFVLAEADLLWLTQTMQGADRPCLVVMHVPVSGQAQTGNYYFQNNPESASLPFAERVRNALALARVPVVCLAGHVHWNSITTVDGIVHLTQQSLTESFTTGGEPAAAMGVVELGETVRWEVVGEDPFACTFRPSARRWVPPLPAFRAHPELARGRNASSAGRSP